MKNRSNATARAGRQVPLDHLRPGGRHPAEPTGEQTVDAGGTGPGPAEPPGTAQPAEPKSPRGGEGDAQRGKATSSPANVSTRPHLEGSEQGPA